MKSQLKSIKSKLQFLKWKLKTSRNRRGSSKDFDVDRVFWISPDRVQNSIDVPNRNRLNESGQKNVTPFLERGAIVDGDWDLNTIAFESQDVWAAFQHRFTKDGKWSETDFYRRVTETMRGGIRMWGCTTPEEFDARLVGIDELYGRIKNDGFKTQDELLPAENRPVGTEDEIQVHIGRNGEYIFADGRHRFCIAKLLQVDKIPVKVARRHSLWADLRRELLSYASKQANSQLYSRLTHPDLADIPAAHGGARFDIISQNIPSTSGRALDIGAHWGFFSSKLEELGLDVTAVEYLPINHYFLKKIRSVEGKKFSMVEGNVLDLEFDDEFEVVLALNIFHHFIKTESDYKKLEKLLAGLNTKCIFFEPHDPKESQMQGVYRNFAPTEFAEWVANKAGLANIREIGAAHDERKIFLIT